MTIIKADIIWEEDSEPRRGEWQEFIIIWLHGNKLYRKLIKYQ